MNQTRLKDDLQVYILSGLIVLGLFTELDRLPIIGFVTFGLLVAIEWLFKNQTITTTTKKIKVDKVPKDNRLPYFHGLNLIFGLLILAPALLVWTAQWTAEFPFSGDHDHHVFAAMAGLEYWRSLFWLPLIWIGVVVYIYKNKSPHFWGIGVLLALWLLSNAYQVPTFYFSRYPAFAYLLTAPFMAIANLMHWPSLVFANQTAQFLSLPIWLFVLRPFFLKRWPDLPILLFAFFIYWQKDFIHYQSAAYLEPWSLVFIALALEMVLTQPLPRWRPLLMIGVATWLKETSILFAPFIWLGIYALPLWKKEKGSLKESIFVGAATITPFIAYYIMRVEDKIFRSAQLMDFSKAFTSGRLNEFLFRLTEQWQVTGLLLLTLLFAAWVWWVRQDRERRFLGFCLLLAVILTLPFYFMDALAIDFPGYPRFYLPTYMLLSSPLLILSTQFKKQTLFALVGMIVTLQFIASFNYVKISFGPSAQRSFTEHFDSPAYFPIRTLVNKAEAQGRVRRGDKIIIRPSIANFYPQSFAVGYRDLNEKFRFAVAPLPADPTACSCTGESKALLIPLITDSGLKSKKPQDAKVKAQANACIEQIKKSCTNVFEQKLSDGQLSGVLGVTTR